MTTMASTGARPSISPPYATAALVWTAAVLRLGLARPPMAGLAAGSAAYSVSLAGLSAWLLPAAIPSRWDDTLRLTGTRPAVAPRYAIVLLALAWAFVYAFATGGAFGGPRVPALTPFLARVARLDLPEGLDGLTLMNFLTQAAVPATLLLAVGTRPRELGLSVPAKGTTAATAACLVVPMGFVVWGFGRGSLTIAVLLTTIVQNLLSNGFTEEFLCRGLFLSALRRGLSNDWSNVIQAMLFALIHAGGTVAEEGRNPALIAANVVALNFPMGLALGVVALRGRSLLLPTIVHVSLHIMKDAVM